MKITRPSVEGISSSGTEAVKGGGKRTNSHNGLDVPGNVPGPCVCHLIKSVQHTSRRREGHRKVN